MKKRNTKYKLTKVDYTIFIICSIGMAIMLYLFYKDMNSFTIKQDEEPIAKIYFKKNTAQRKFIDNDIWEILTDTSDIYDGDKIRTSQNSEAYTKFNDSEVEIQLRQKSMIQMFKNKKDKSVEFLSGEMSLSNNSSNNDFVIISGDKEIKVAKKSEVRIEIPSNVKSNTLAEKSIKVEVVQGKAEITDIKSAKKALAPESIKTVDEGQIVSVKFNEPISNSKKPTSEPDLKQTEIIKTDSSITMIDDKSMLIKSDDSVAKEDFPIAEIDSKIDESEGLPYVESSSVNSAVTDNASYYNGSAFVDSVIAGKYLEKDSDKKDNKISSTVEKKVEPVKTVPKTTKVEVAKTQIPKSVKLEEQKSVKKETATTKVEPVKTETVKTAKAESTKTETAKQKTSETSKESESSETKKSEQVSKIDVPDVAGDRNESVPTIVDAIKEMVTDSKNTTEEKTASEKSVADKTSGEKFEIPDVAGDRDESTPTIFEAISDFFEKANSEDEKESSNEKTASSDKEKTSVKEIPDVAGERNSKTIVEALKEVAEESEEMEEGINIPELISNITLASIKNSYTAEEVVFENNMYNPISSMYNYQFIIKTSDVTAANKKIPKGTVIDLELSGVPDKDEPVIAIQMTTGENEWKRAHDFLYTYINNGAGFKAGVPFTVKRRIVLTEDIVNTDKSYITISYDPWHLDESCKISNFQIKGSVVALNSETVTDSTVSGFTKNLTYDEIHVYKKMIDEKDFIYEFEINANDVFGISKQIAEGMKVEVSISGKSDKAFSNMTFQIDENQNEEYVNLLGSDNEQLVLNIGKTKSNEKFNFSKTFIFKQPMISSDLTKIIFFFDKKYLTSAAVLSDVKISFELMK